MIRGTYTADRTGALVRYYVGPRLIASIFVTAAKA